MILCFIYLTIKGSLFLRRCIYPCSNTTKEAYYTIQFHPAKNTTSMVPKSIHNCLLTIANNKKGNTPLNPLFMVPRLYAGLKLILFP